MFRALTRRAQDEAGVALVETALTMLVLIGLVFAVIQSCIAIYSYHYLANASHEAARYAIVRGGDWGRSCTDYTDSQCTASTDDVANYVQSRDFPGINITANQVFVQYFSTMQSSVSTGCPGTNSATTNDKTGDIVQVTICYPFTFGLPGIGNYTWNLASTSQMIIAQ